MKRMKDKVVMVTGGASGVGREDVLLFIREGARVVLTDINVEAGQSLVREVGDSAVFLPHDISSEDDWKRVMASTVQAFGRLDVLVNNAAILQMASIDETTLEMWRTVQRINSDGYFLGCKYAVSQMKTTGGGSIVNMSSLAAVAGLSAFCAYSASKGAVSALTRSVAAHCRAHNYNIRCNSIHPDGIRTPMLASIAASIPPEILAQGGEQMAARMADPIDIANVVLFLASDESRFVNGVELRVDNGYLLNADL